MLRHPAPDGLRGVARQLILGIDNTVTFGYGWPMSDATTIIDALEHAGYRVTGPRRTLATLIAARGGTTFTAGELVADVRARRLGIGRATVFRAIELLESVGAVERVDLQNGDHVYVACVPTHHHHVICARCARTAEIGDLGLGAVAREVARRTGYRVDEHRLELFGLCPDCQLAVTPA
jgi:Fur family ferric uptake transcriptional regulator